MVGFSGSCNFICLFLKHCLSLLLKLYFCLLSKQLLTIFEHSNMIKVTEETIKIRKGILWVEAALPPRSKEKKIRCIE